MRPLRRGLSALLILLVIVQPLGYAAASPATSPATSPAASPAASPAGGTPAIILAKTVGLSPEVCASGTSVTVPPGNGAVYYCYEVTNTGSITLTRHTLVDNRLGTLLSNFTYSLGPGASAFITQAATITTSTFNTAEWFAFNPGPIDLVSASASARVSAPRPGISLTKTVGLDPGVCANGSKLVLPPGGDTVIYCYRVRNTGMLTFTLHTLSDSALGPLLTNFPFGLAPGASAFITASAVITRPTFNTAAWTSYNAGPSNTVTATASAQVDVLGWLFMPLVKRD